MSSFSTARRRGPEGLSRIRCRLDSAGPGQPVGVSRPFRAAAYLRADASPNEESTNIVPPYVNPRLIFLVPVTVLLVLRFVLRRDERAISTPPNGKISSSDFIAKHFPERRFLCSSIWLPKHTDSNFSHGFNHLTKHSASTSHRSIVIFIAFDERSAFILYRWRGQRSEPRLGTYRGITSRAGRGDLATPQEPPNESVFVHRFDFSKRLFSRKENARQLGR